MYSLVSWLFSIEIQLAKINVHCSLPITCLHVFLIIFLSVMSFIYFTMLSFTSQCKPHCAEFTEHILYFVACFAVEFRVIVSIIIALNKTFYLPIRIKTPATIARIAIIIAGIGKLTTCIIPVKINQMASNIIPILFVNFILFMLFILFTSP
jgi:hypothetical protein